MAVPPSEVSALSL